ncbi:hypothetical protein [Frondihabitans sp. PAMC 28766]|nr:hypothetical protein [Frondihabitans sp. PAMC 28766]
MRERFDALADSSQLTAGPVGERFVVEAALPVADPTPHTTETARAR